MDEVEYISVNAVFDESSGLGPNLPVHKKCEAHTLNLITSVALDCFLQVSLQEGRAQGRAAVEPEELQCGGGRQHSEYIEEEAGNP